MLSSLGLDHSKDVFYGDAAAWQSCNSILKPLKLRVWQSNFTKSTFVEASHFFGQVPVCGFQRPGKCRVFKWHYNSAAVGVTLRKAKFTVSLWFEKKVQSVWNAFRNNTAATCLVTQDESGEPLIFIKVAFQPFSQPRKEMNSGICRRPWDFFAGLVTITVFCVFVSLEVKW